MINLIPFHEKKRVRLEYWLRVFTVWTLLFSFAILLVICVMVPAYVLISVQINSGAETSRSAQEKVVAFEAAGMALQAANKQALAIVNNGQLVPISNHIELIRRYENVNLQVSAITIARTADYFAPLQVSGQAATRQALAAFREQLLAESQVESVELPISNLAKDRDIQFNLTVVLRKSI